MSKKKAIPCFVVLFLLVALWQARFFIVFGLLPESVDCSRGSFTYWLCIDSKLIKEFPCTGAIGRITYHEQTGDPGSPWNGVSYISTTSHSELIAAIDQYVKSRGYRCKEDFCSEPGIRQLTYMLANNEVRVLLEELPTRQTRVYISAREDR